MRRGSLDEALAKTDALIRDFPRWAQPRAFRAHLLLRSSRLDEALAEACEAATLDPASFEALAVQADALRERGRNREALNCYDSALRSRPGEPVVTMNRAALLNRMGDFHGALAGFEEVLRFRPANAKAHANRARALRNLGRDAEAAAAFREALRLDPENPKFHHDYALLELARGNFADGWREREWRWRDAKGGPPHRVRGRRLWDGDPHAGRLLVWPEQGVGDHVLYGSMLRDLALRTPEAMIALDARLVPLFRRSFADTRLAFIDEASLPDLDSFDVHIPIGSLTRFFRPSTESFRAARFPFLQADPSRVQRLRSPGGTGGRMRIGLSWRSRSPKHGGDKSAPLELFRPLLAVPGALWCSLQYGETAEEIAAVSMAAGISIHEFAGLDLYNDLDGLAAAISGCDVVVTTSNVTAHLCGALGKKTLLLLPRSVGRFWFWQDIDGVSLWYPSIRVLRQTRQGDWSGPLSEVRRILGEEHV